MDRKWLLVGAGVVAIVAAIALFPSPDTSPNLPDPNAANAHPQAALRGSGALGRPGAVGGPKVARREFNPATAYGPNPVAAELARNANTPEAVYAGRITGPLAMARRGIMLTEKPEAAPFAEESLTLMTDLRTLRKDPTKADFPTLEERLRGFVGKVRASEFGAIPDVKTSLDRIDGYLEEYHTNPQIPTLPPARPLAPPPVPQGDPPPAPPGQGD